MAYLSPDCGKLLLRLANNMYDKKKSQLKVRGQNVDDERGQLGLDLLINQTSDASLVSSKSFLPQKSLGFILVHS